MKLILSDIIWAEKKPGLPETVVIDDPMLVSYLTEDLHDGMFRLKTYLTTTYQGTVDTFTVQTEGMEGNNQ